MAYPSVGQSAAIQESTTIQTNTTNAGIYYGALITQMDGLVVFARAEGAVHLRQHCTPDPDTRAHEHLGEEEQKGEKKEEAFSGFSDLLLCDASSNSIAHACFSSNQKKMSYRNKY